MLNSTSTYERTEYNIEVNSSALLTTQKQCNPVAFDSPRGNHVRHYYLSLALLGRDVMKLLFLTGGGGGGGENLCKNPSMLGSSFL
mmetsp:Transcript_29048/g.68278  ORF Transcript_29048/g.68278 Transcript_29048/m.68278 type:complete len:86 (+) Transcript_29048:39-296(+)